MSKVGRNDPCPCGSGKKYKKCHGAANVIELNPGIYDAELEELQFELMEFAVNHYEHEMINSFIDSTTSDLIDDEHVFQSYMSNLTTWVILNRPINHGETIFELFYKEKQREIKRERVKKVFSSWADVAPSFYEVMADMGEYALLKDIRTEKTFEVKTIGEEPFEEGNILVGILLPYVQRYAVFFGALEFYKLNPAVVAESKNMSDDQFNRAYPEILQKLFEPVESDEEIMWDNPLYEMVAMTVEKNMKKKQADVNLIEIAMLVWKLFTTKENPSFQKLGSYAAAVEYVLQTDILHDPLQTQQSLAREYGVSVTTLTKNAKKIREALAVELPDIAAKWEDVFEDEDEEDEAMLESSAFTTEQMLRDVQKLLASKEFETEEEMHAFLNQHLNDSELIDALPDSPRDRAQNKLFEAYEAKGAKRKKLIQEALALHSDSPDAYILMAEDAKTQNEQYQLYHQAVVVGEKDLGKKFIAENKGRFWLMTETRPYMRAKEKLANFLYHYGEKDEAIQCYEELLQLNPGDNQGIRYLLLTIYLKEKKFTAAKRLFNQFHEEVTAQFQFNRVLLLYYEKGVTKATLKFLEKADDLNPFVRDYILGDLAIPTKKYERIGIGDQSEAVTYAQDNWELWEDAEPLIAAWRNI